MIDPELVTRKLALITADLRRLRPFAEKPRDAFLASDTDEVLVERYLERIIGRMIDVNYHLVTEAGLPPPRDYFQSFTDLARIGAASPEFAQRLAACAGLRNRLVHEYDEIDTARLHEAAAAALADVPEYMRGVEAYVVRSSPG